ncbi:carboxymuconolactone decarboxylase family protein [Kitasatospora viridis]|uniref:AhpD family alkylhydroperoxidase n=1 Tax=Kitasatospora viridis TaxID=281105 RepID=A0A561UGP3_9ACTN|nr:carboxymuconolactone decarboxylase family protein [Kitasatospora viridis]TWF98538.1 AhpD family alkylhydroperoxidase [Kitasatospora viridis]
MEQRLDLFARLGTDKTLKHFMAGAMAFKESAVPLATRELVSLRISQINGCAACIDMHVKEAAAAGEADLRLHLVAAWREAGGVFTEAERAALELAEQGTRLADPAGGVTDEAWADAAKHYDEGQLTTLVTLIAFMNLANRLNVITRQPAGTYRAGQLD